jgi:hypothetical protein
MGVIDDILPADRSDAAPITTHLRGLLEQLHNGQGERPRITITLEQDAWAMLEAQFRRPYRPHSSYMYLPLDVGTVAFERKREATPEPPPEASKLCPHGVDVSPGSAFYCTRCMGAPLKRPVSVDVPERFTFLGDPAGATLTPEVQAQLDAARAQTAAWTPSAIEAKAALLEGERSAAAGDGGSSGPRSESAIYDAAPLSAPATAVEANVPTYGGPWKGDGK